jgi:hypothetical protein
MTHKGLWNKTYTKLHSIFLKNADFYGLKSIKSEFVKYFV